MINLQEYAELLQQNLNSALRLLEGLSVSDLEWGSEDKWSLLQIAEHILLTEEMVMGILAKGSTEMAVRLELFGSEKLNYLLVKLRGRKVKAPHTLEPRGSIRSVKDFEEEMLKLRKQLISHLESGEWMISTETYKHPMLGEMTVSDWLYFILHHSERHQHQMQDRLRELAEFKAGL